MININCLTFLGILGSIFDGIQRPLKVSIETVTVTGHQSSFMLSINKMWNLKLVEKHVFHLNGQYIFSNYFNELAIKKKLKKGGRKHDEKLFKDNTSC